MNVYLVLNQDYDSCEVRGIFDSLELAEEAAKRCGIPNKDIKTIELNALPAMKFGTYAWRVRMKHEGPMLSASPMDAVGFDGEYAHFQRYGSGATFGVDIYVVLLGNTPEDAMARAERVRSEIIAQWNRTGQQNGYMSKPNEEAWK